MALGVALFAPALLQAEEKGPEGPDLLVEADDHTASMDFFEKKGKYRDAIHHGRLAANLYAVLGRKRTAGRVLQKVADLLRATGLRNAAMVELKRAMALQEETGDVVGLAVSRGSLGLVKAAGPKPAEGVRDFLAGLELAVDRNLTGARRVLLDAAEGLYRKLTVTGSTPAGFAFLARLAELCSEAGLYHRTEKFLYLRHSSLLAAGAPDDALEDLDRLETLAESRGYAFGRAEACKHRGLLYLGRRDGTRSENLDKARGWFEREQVLRREIRDDLGRAWCLNNLGYVLTLLGKHARARELLQASRSLFDGLAVNDGLAKALHNLKNLGLKTADKGLVKAVEELLGTLAGRKTPKTREFDFKPTRKRLAYYMFQRVADTDPIVEITAAEKGFVFRDVATGEVFETVPYAPEPVRVSISVPVMVKLFTDGPGMVAQSVFVILARRYLKYGDTILFMAPGSRAYSIRQNRLVLVKDELPVLRLTDRAADWKPSGAFPDRSNPVRALATFVEAVNRGVKDGGEGRDPVLVKGAWDAFQATLSGFAAAVIGQVSFRGTAEKRMQVPLKVEVVGAWSIKACWAKVRYRHAPDLARAKVSEKEALEIFERQKFAGLYTAYLVKEGSSWKVDFLAGRD